LLKQYEKKELGRLVSDNLLDKDNLKELFIFLRNAIKTSSFYNLSFIDAEQIVGDWMSTKETGQLRINYNMTDLTPMGNQIRLRIEKHSDEFYSFLCFAKAHHYRLDQVQDIKVFGTLVKIVNGYFHHYRESDLMFIFKRPIYNFNGNMFTTQTNDIEFSFKKKTIANINLYLL